MWKKKIGFNIINKTNSSLGVQCNAKGICAMRHTQLCEDCKHNCGHKEDENYYESIKR